MFIVLFTWGERVAFKILICGFAHFEFLAISLFLDVEFRIIFKTPSIVSSLRDCMQIGIRKFYLRKRFFDWNLLWSPRLA